MSHIPVPSDDVDISDIRDEDKALQRALKKTLGSVARRARTARGWTQEDVADRLGVTSEFYARIERGLALPGLGTAVRIADLHGLDFDVLLGIQHVDLSHLRVDEDTRRFRKLIRRARRMNPQSRRLVERILDGLLPESDSDSHN